MQIRSIKWMSGITTVPERFNSLLPQTLQSVTRAGFTIDRVFVDGGGKQIPSYLDSIPLTLRDPTIRTFGNWVLGIAELYIREPTADRYIMFQDDLVIGLNVKSYLDKCQFPDHGYWNLYTTPESHDLVSDPTKGGWVKSHQRGRGALALVFDNEGLRKLLSHAHMIDRPRHASRGWRNIDGGIVTAMNKTEYNEYIHFPSLVQHTGHNSSSMSNRQHPLCTNFLGENFDYMSLLK